MEIAECEKVLLQSITVYWVIFAACAIICLIPMVMWLCKRKTIRKTRAQRRSFEALLSLRDYGILIAIIVFCYTAYRTAPAIIDICSDSYVCVHAEYSRHHINTRSPENLKISTDDGEVVFLKIPRHSGMYSYGAVPEGDKLKATIWYGENSEYVLLVIPDE